MDFIYNHLTCDWSAQYIDETYQAQWIPETIPTLIFAGEYYRITPLKLFNNAPQFNRSNILIKTISNAGHYPWIDNPHGVSAVFKEYLNLLDK